MWIVYALSASVIWGVSYAASGRVIERGVSPLSFFFYYVAASALLAGLALACAGKMTTVSHEVQGLGADMPWLIVAVVAVVASGVGSLFIYMAIGGKNAILASLIEISYPLFVALFAWLFFRETHLNAVTTGGWPSDLGRRGSCVYRQSWLRKKG